MKFLEFADSNNIIFRLHALIISMKSIYIPYI